MQTVTEQLAEALEAVLTPCPPENHIVGADGVCPECNVEKQARAALARYRAEPETLLREAGQARRELGERVRDGK